MHSRTLLSRLIELLLDYCSRFYERQFITREEKNKSLLRRLERLVDSGIDEGCLERGHFPTAAEWAADLGLSEAYFCDLLRFQTGKTPTEYLYFRRLEAAKRMLQADRATPAQVSRRLGFANVCQFSFVFKKYTGQAPGEYRLN
jgi:AraC-like DNA-binding protein